MSHARPLAAFLNEADPFRVGLKGIVTSSPLWIACRAWARRLDNLEIM